MRPPLACTADDFRAIVAALSSDDMRGRTPGDRGIERAAEQIASAFRDAGLAPLPDGTYLQRTPLVRVQPSDSQRGVTVVTREGKELVIDREVSLRTERSAPSIIARGELWFAGFGIDARELGWTDFGDRDLTGAVVLVLRGVPQNEGDRFPGGPNGRAVRDVYKLEVARAAGAAGVILVHPGAAPELDRYGNSFIRLEPEQENGLALVARMSGNSVRRLLEYLAVPVDSLMDAAGQLDFQAVPLGAQLQATVSQTIRPFESSNVIGVLPGDPGEEAVLFTAHYDGLGLGAPDAAGDSIFNGALDNASGTAALICLAHTFAKRQPLERTVVFMATTAEESGTLGVQHYLRHPVHPLASTVAVLNIDGINTYGPADDYFVMPTGSIRSDQAFSILADDLGIDIVAGQKWTSGMHFSFDTHPFNERGTPSFTVWQGQRIRGRSAEELRVRQADIGRRHHTLDDEITDAWDAEGILQHLELYYVLGLSYAGGGVPPRLVERHPFLPPLRTKR